jgi:branched-chain amino acid transport system substrate-binding protein
MTRSHLRTLGLAVCLLLVAVSCGGDDTTSTTAAGAAASTTQGEAAPTTAASGTAAPGTTTGEDLPPITIGLMTDLSGRLVSFGKDFEVATNLAVEAVNAEGGVNGSMLEIETVDTAGEPDQAVVGYQELADEGVFAVSGPLSSGEAEVLFPQAPEVMVPIITGTANKERITDPGEGWALRNTATNTALYTVAMPEWASEYGVSTAVLVYDEQEAVTVAAATLAIPDVAADVGVEIVNADDPVTIVTGQGDFASTVQRIGDLEADGLIVISFPQEAGLLAREMARQGETRPVLGHPAQGGATFFEQGGTDINDWVLPSIFNGASEDPVTQAYIAAMAEADPEPPTVSEAANYYDNILMLAEVMRQAGIDGTWDPVEARAAIRDGMLAVSGFKGVAGETTFQPNGDADKTVYVNVVTGGEPGPLGG